ncbi:alpha-galactosidase [Ningiella sp. W23]|uniref:alpha-galactosidase n=1 Tax=Ningiella sp. W23 TaxID=3023715 RepID=UPI003757E348
MANYPEFVQLNARNCTIIIRCKSATPEIIYYGQALSNTTSLHMLAHLSTRQEAKCAVVHEPPISLSPCLGDGFTGHPGITIDDGDIAWSVSPKLIEVEQSSQQSVVFTSIDAHRHIQIRHQLELDYESQVLACSSIITNLNSRLVTVVDLAAPTIALPDHINRIMAFEGRWSHEFQTRTLDLFLGAYVRENRKGKTSHDNFPGVIVHDEHTHEYHGECYGFHLGWSGNHRTRVELLPEQRTYVQMGELLGSGEVKLSLNERYASPTLYVSYSSSGLTPLSQQFHQFVRQHLLDSRFHSKPRPVHYNTWEGIYFNHDVDALKTLADKAALAGAERFVLDDGWFNGRRHDKAGLGDWQVDNSVYPDGLGPLIQHVVSKGMQFGIWFEPEMVNPDSELYRAHPDWVLSTQGNEQLNFRHQLVLDLTRKEVQEYLYEQIATVLNTYPDISYIKWDMNRDINHSGDKFGVSAVHKQTQQVYALIARIKRAHPNVEIESCSSGGARIDFGILQHTDRVWTSDSNDALDRLSIQRGYSFFLPSNLMGSHVGPRDCHITGRHIKIETRIAVAMFGHMGMEMDPRELSGHEMKTLQQGIALYKEKRHLIHSGDYFRINNDDISISFGIVSQDKAEGLFSYNSITETKRTQPKKYRFVGLDARKTYRLKLIWPTQLYEYSPSILSFINGECFTGEALMQMGMQLPIIFPQTSLVFSVNSE